MQVILWLAVAGMALPAADGFDPIGMVQERAARERRTDEKASSAKVEPVKTQETKRAEWLAALDKQIRELEVKRDVNARN